MKRNWKIIWVALVISLLLFSGFAILSNNATAANTVLKDNSENKDTLIVAIREDITSLNMFDPSTYLAVKTGALGWCYDTLMGYTPQLDVYLDLAESYQADSTGLNITVHIRHGVTFHDGTELTAKDVAFTYEVLAYDHIYANLLDSLIWPNPQWTLYNGTGTSHVGVEVADKYTVVFHLYQPYPLFYQVTLNMPIIPANVWKNHVKTAGTGDSDDIILDYSYGSIPSQGSAADGTGPFKFVEWKPGAYVIFDRYTNYWGKNLTIPWQGKNWPAYPQHVKRLVFKIYNSADTAVLALKKGEVHLTDIAVGYYNSLRLDPHVGISIINGDNFYFMPFNLRKAPMNNLNFRTAVAHSVDRDYIVTTLAHGFATKGTVPLAIISGAYINTSAVPPGFDLNAAKQVLDNAGYKDINGDGWREAPDGKPLKLSILSPTKDYSPIMADIGIMIQNNLRNVGINIVNTPLDFYTLVSRMIIQVDYDMLVMGYTTGSPFPETYLKDFFYSKYASPVGNNMAGYSNPKVDKLLDEMTHEMNTQRRIKIIKDIQGILTHDLPWVTLCYIKFLIGYRKDVWQGWISAYAGIMNIFSLGQLHHPGGPPPNPHGTTTTVSEKYNGAVLHAYLPAQAYAGKDIQGYAFVTDNDGVPIPNVNVQVYASTGYVFNGTTGDSGGFKFTVPLPFQIYHGPVKVTYSMSAKIGDQYYNYTESKDIRVYLPKSIAKLSLSLNKNILSPGENADVMAKVTDLLGHPLSGVNVTVSTEETLGSITPYAITNTQGIATLEYTAPATLKNINMMDSITASISVNNTILQSMQTATLLIPVQSEGNSWYRVSIESVGSYGLTAGNSTDIKIKVVDANGNPVANHEVYIEAIYSTAANPQWQGEVAEIDNNTNVHFDADHKTTDAHGEVTFTMSAVNNINRPYIVRAYTKDTYSVFDSVEIYVGNATGADPYIGSWTANYGMNISITPDVVNGANGMQPVKVTVNVYYANGTPAANVQGFFGLFSTDYGAGAAWPNDEHRIYNPFIGDYYSFVTDENGTASVIATTNQLIGDQAVYADAWIDPGIGGGLWLGATFEYPYLFGVKQGFVLERANVISLADFSCSSFYLDERDASTEVSFKVIGKEGPLPNATAYATWKIGSYSSSSTVTTNENGTATIPIQIMPGELDGVITLAVSIFHEGYSMGSNAYEFKLVYLANTEEMKNIAVLSNLSVNPEIVSSSGAATITLQFVGGLTGLPLSGENVTLSVSGGKLDSYIKTTDSQGKVIFKYTAPAPLLNEHYPVVGNIGTEQFVFGVSVKGQYATTGDVVDELNKIPVLQGKLQNMENNYTTLQTEHQKLQKDYSNMKDQKNSATTMEYVFLVLFIIFLILTPVAYIAGKKKAPSVPEETGEEETPEETEEIMEEEEPEEKESSEEESTEEENKE